MDGVVRVLLQARGNKKNPRRILAKAKTGKRFIMDSPIKKANKAFNHSIHMNQQNNLRIASIRVT
jgi:hypothetical protein